MDQYCIEWQKSDFLQTIQLCHSYEDLYIRYSSIFKKFYLEKRSYSTFERPDWIKIKELSKNEIYEAIKADITFWMKEDQDIYDNSIPK